MSSIPSHFVKLGHLNTPIEKWKLRNIPNEFKVDIKRDDMTGSTLSGNKVRKLEFLLADAIKKGCKHVITCGSIQSNFARSTAVASAQLGLNCHLFLRSTELDSSNLQIDGNVLVEKLCGANIYLIPKSSQYENDIKPKMERLALQIREQKRETSYLIPVGGSDIVGLYGYITAFDEMVSQGLLEQYDDIVFACGSGGTAAGLAIANYLNQSTIKIHAVTVCDNKKYFTDHINATLDAVGLGDCVSADQIVNIIDGYKGLGYGLSTPEELEFIQAVSRDTGIILDPCYSGKAAYGLTKELQSNHHTFQGNRILFIHTGGIFSLFDGKMGTFLKDSCKNEPDVLESFR